eukprot:2116046-Ditylum_brightwellii.AAC.1
MVDANSSLNDKAFAPFVAEVGLCDVIGTAHGIDTPNTHAEGSKPSNLSSAHPFYFPPSDVV